MTPIISPKSLQQILHAISRLSEKEILVETGREAKMIFMDIDRLELIQLNCA